MTLPKGFGEQPKSGAKRTYEQWWATVPDDLKTKTRKGDENNKPLLNQVNYVYCTSIWQVNTTQSQVTKSEGLATQWTSRCSQDD